MVRGSDNVRVLEKLWRWLFHAVVLMTCCALVRGSFGDIRSDRAFVVLVIRVLEVHRVLAVVLGVMMCLSSSVPGVHEVLCVEGVHPRRCRVYR